MLLQPGSPNLSFFDFWKDRLNSFCWIAAGSPFELENVALIIPILKAGIGYHLLQPKSTAFNQSSFVRSPVPGGQGDSFGLQGGGSSLEQAGFSRDFPVALRSRLPLRKGAGWTRGNPFPPGFLIHRPPRRAVPVGKNWERASIEPSARGSASPGKSLDGDRKKANLQARVSLFHFLFGEQWSGFTGKPNLTFGDRVRHSRRAEP